MDLAPYGYAVGISDIKDYIECPARMEHGMQRHTIGEAPEHRNWTNAYGSMAHDCIHLVTTESLSNEEAIDRLWPTYGPYLYPEHLQQLREDLDQYRRDTPAGFELVCAEKDMRYPLFIHEGQQIYFRFKIDALYRNKEDPSLFLMRDYKSSAHRKSDREVHEDIQMTAYNLGIHELFPECRRLIQIYEQLRFGNVPTSRNDQQRREMREWLIQHIKAILGDHEHAPKINDFCRWCPLVMKCEVTERATTYWRGSMAILAPTTKEGRKLKVELVDDLEEVERLITDVLPRAIQTRKHLEMFEDKLKGLLKDLSADRREELGWRLGESKSKRFSPEGLARIHEAVGSIFYSMVTLNKTSADRLLGKPTKTAPLTPQQESIRREELEAVSLSTIERIDQ